MAKKVTISDISERLGISKSTVSKALTNATDINEETRERVLSCASEIGYYVKPFKSVKSKNIIVFIYGVNYDNVDQFGYELTLGLQAAATEAGYGVRVETLNINDIQEGKYYRIMKKGNFVGSFFIGFEPHPTFIRHIEEINVPVVILDNEIQSSLTARIGTDFELGISQIVKYIYSLGHKTIAFLGGEEFSNVTIERQKYYENALQELGIKPEGRLIAYAKYSGEGIETPVLELLSQKPTAIICAGDVIACNTINFLHTKGFTIPGDISITGFDNLHISKYVSPTLTTVAQNRIQIGKCAFSLIMQMKNGASISRLELKPELIIRDSTAAPKDVAPTREDIR